jgi:hypothetical protein
MLGSFCVRQPLSARRHGECLQGVGVRCSGATIINDRPPTKMVSKDPSPCTLLPQETGSYQKKIS